MFVHIFYLKFFSVSPACFVFLFACLIVCLFIALFVSFLICQLIRSYMDRFSLLPRDFREGYAAAPHWNFVDFREGFEDFLPDKISRFCIIFTFFLMFRG